MTAAPLARSQLPGADLRLDADQIDRWSGRVVARRVGVIEWHIARLVGAIVIPVAGLIVICNSPAITERVGELVDRNRRRIYPRRPPIIRCQAGTAPYTRSSSFGCASGSRPTYRARA